MTALQRVVLRMPLLLQLGAIATVIFELCFGFAILPKRTRLCAAAAGLLFHNLTNLFMNISFWALQWSYVVFVDWTAVIARLRQRFATRLGQRATEVGTREPRLLSSPTNKLATWCQLVILAAFSLAGVMHRVDSWPIACFPTFDAPAKAKLRKLSVKLLDSTGSTYEAILSFDRELSVLLVSDRWEGLVAHFIDMGFRPKTAVALIHLWQANHRSNSENPKMAALQSATFFVDTYALDLSSGAQSLIRRKAFGTVTVADGL
jgi:hypothetical protein